ncbi:MAG: GerMN domain-containing protein [Anaerolineales bacterium]
MRNWTLFVALVAISLLAASCAPAATPTVTQPPLRPVLLFYYNPELDEDSTGNIQCSEAGLVAVMRELPASVEGEALIGETIRLLISGELSNEERAQGVTTEFPLEGLKLTDVRLDGGVLTLTFDDPNFRTSGGACRSGVLWAQIEQTALQFPGVQQVRFEPESVFQP